MNRREIELIKAIRVWVERAGEYASSGDLERSIAASRSALAMLTALDGPTLPKSISRSALVLKRRKAGRSRP